MHKNRRRQRGAVLLESLVVSVLLVVFLACTVFVHALYANKIDGTAKARAQAWERALPGCEGGLTELAIDALSGGAFDALVAADAFEVIETPSWLSDMSRGIGAPPDVTVTADAVIGAHAVTLSSRNAIACNEYGDDASGSLLINAVDIVRQLVPGISDR